mmetsp:Transcript_22164/g.57831  ORF Transcript_22164/g.57831 Transcript_22164/m.57831 type:complete len:203 (+) Transcript_22164:510-1118(+)
MPPVAVGSSTRRLGTRRGRPLAHMLDQLGLLGLQAARRRSARVRWEQQPPKSRRRRLRPAVLARGLGAWWRGESRDRLRLLAECRGLERRPPPRALRRHAALGAARARRRPPRRSDLAAALGRPRHCRRHPRRRCRWAAGRPGPRWRGRWRPHGRPPRLPGCSIESTHLRGLRAAAAPRPHGGPSPQTRLWGNTRSLLAPPG